jgi:uncharacterized protein YdiU (UPF0061 family)
VADSTTPTTDSAGADGAGAGAGNGDRSGTGEQETGQRPLPPSLARLRFDNRFVRDLPADPVHDDQPRPVRAAYSRVRPTPVGAPRVLAYSCELSTELGIDPVAWTTPEAAAVFAGNRLLPGSDPHAMNYGGHQFGSWAGQLGDGRAINLGEVAVGDGRHLTLQLKGAGRTPYARGADGRAVLRSSIREFLCSEAMHHLGVPTTRALSLVATGDEVVRDLLYDGNPRSEPAAIVCRVAPSFLRFGTYQLPAARDDLLLLRSLADHTIRAHFPHLLEGAHLAGGVGDLSPETYAAWFDEMCRSSAELVVQWMRVGFVHGVLNTDNLSVHGITIDYGPYGWIDDFDPDWTPNTTDAATRRYRFGHQPAVVQWNLVQLANALLPLIGEVAPLQESLSGFAATYRADHRAMMLAKLGLAPGGDDADDELIDGLVGALQVTEIDMTLFYRRLAGVPSAVEVDEVELLAPGLLGDALYQPESVGERERSVLVDWLARYRRRLRADGIDDIQRARAMDRVNPLYVLRNYLAQQAIDAAEAGDAGPVNDLLDLLRRPYDTQPGREAFAAKRPDWARDRPGCSTLSCSS